MNILNEQNELDSCRQQISSLKRENDELLRKLYEVNNKLLYSEKYKGHFISNVTNEIVNPFTSVIALAQSIKSLSDTEMPVARHMADLIFEEAFHLDFQLKNIFAAALIEAGKTEIASTAVNLTELTNQLIQYFEPLTVKKGIKLTVSIQNQNGNADTSMFYTDKDKLDLIVKNLVSNSVKYSPEQSEIFVGLKILNSELTVEVADHGKGISPENRQIIFDRFRQLDERINSVNTGHGLGLSIVEAFTSILGGSIMIEDNAGGGIVVKVSIPKSAENSEWDDLEDFIIDSETSF